jgi:uncharacterized protein
MKHMIVLAFALAMSLGAVAQQAASADQPATREDVVRMMEATGIRSQYERMQTAMLEQMKDLFPATEDEHFTAAQRAKIKDISGRMIAETMNAYPVTDAINDIVPIYQKYFTRADVGAITAFYLSPAGHKFVHQMPEITSEYMAIVVPKMRERTRPIMDKYRKEFDDALKTTAGTGQSTPKPSK